MDIKEKALNKHYEWQGKIEVKSTVAVKDSEALSLAYTPGVAQPCLEIQKDYNKSFELTGRGNTVAVITDGTAVLGLGDIGPEAGMPVMEGKCLLFKEYGGIDAIPLCIRSKSVDPCRKALYKHSGKLFCRHAHKFIEIRHDILCLAYALKQLHTRSRLLKHLLQIGLVHLAADQFDQLITQKTYILFIQDGVLLCVDLIAVKAGPFAAPEGRNTHTIRKILLIGRIY